MRSPRTQDGIDVSGVDIEVRDVHVLNADDSVCVKPSGGAAEDRFACTERVRVANATLIGVGASIGSVVPTDGAPACVRGVAFSRVAMPGTLKGIHVKTDEGDGGARASAVVEDVLFEDVTVDDAAWWAVWLGPQQEEDVNKRTACRFSYPRRRPAANDCLAARGVALRNLTLRRVRVSRSAAHGGERYAGFVLGNLALPSTPDDRDGEVAPLEPTLDVTFDDVEADEPIGCASARVTLRGGTRRDLFVDAPGPSAVGSAPGYAPCSFEWSGEIS